MTVSEIERANNELADWIEAAVDTLPRHYRPATYAADLIRNLAEHIRQGRIGDPDDAFNEITPEDESA